jgi:hypothetical protein
MARVGFTIHGFGGGDERDYFPFEFPSFTTAELALYPAQLTLKEAESFILRQHSWRILMDITVFDDVASTPADTNFEWSMNPVDRVFTGSFGDEREIHPAWARDLPYKADYTYPTAVYDPYFGSGFATMGDANTPPLSFSGGSSSSFGAYFQASASIEGGDLGDRETIAQLSTLYTDDGTWRVSAVEGSFCGKPFLVYERSVAPYDHPATGGITVEPLVYWSYNGIWHTTTGAKLITPTPEGF